MLAGRSLSEEEGDYSLHSVHGGGQAVERETVIAKLLGELSFVRRCLAELGQPVFSLVSRVFLKEHERIIEQLTRTGHGMLLCYTLQQIEQFRSMGEDFVMQHADTDYMGKLEEELQTAVLETIPVEKRLRGLSPEEVLRRFTPEQVAGGLSDERAARLRELLERRQRG